MKAFLAIVLLSLFLGSCASGVYSHYPKGKKYKKPKARINRTGFSKQHYSVNQLIVRKHIELQIGSDTLGLLPENCVPQRVDVLLSKRVTKPLGDGKPKDATQTNKKAKKAFISSIIALGSMVAGITLAPFFLGLMVLFAAIAFYYSYRALKEIKRTGEFGRTKAEFALYTSIPILILSIFGLIAFLMSNGTGIQIGSFILR